MAVAASEGVDAVCGCCTGATPTDAVAAVAVEAGRVAVGAAAAGEEEEDDDEEDEEELEDEEEDDLAAPLVA